MFFNRSITLLIIISVALVLCSCSASIGKEEKVDIKNSDGDSVEEKAPSVEVEPREPVYVYDKHPGNNLKEVALSLNNEPLLLSNGYLRLVGVVSGGKPLALVEIGGRGICAEIGGRIGDYSVVSISEKEINLKRKEAF